MAESHISGKWFPVPFHIAVIRTGDTRYWDAVSFMLFVWYPGFRSLDKLRTKKKNQPSEI
jgi:hypothetical protein